MENKKMNILIVRKMSSLEYYYNGNHPSQELNASMAEQDTSLARTTKILDDKKAGYKIITRREISKENFSDYDLVFSAGGDGTVIAVAAYNKETPQLNLKTDERSIGALCQQNLENAVRKTLEGDYKLEEWTRQDVFLNGNLVGRVLNETCIGEQLRFDKMAKYNLSIYKNSILTLQERQENSGVIIATGTGSGGWPAAFSKFSKDSKLFKFYANLPFKGSNVGEGEYFIIEYGGHEGKFALDTISYDFPKDSILEIKISEKPLKVIIPD